MSLDPASVDRAALGAPLVPRFPIRLRDTEVFTVVYRTRREAIERLLPAQLEARDTLVAVHLYRMHDEWFGSQRGVGRAHSGRAPSERHKRRLLAVSVRRERWRSRGCARSTASRKVRPHRDRPEGDQPWRLWRNGIDVATATMAYKQQQGDSDSLVRHVDFRTNINVKMIPAVDGQGASVREITARTFADVEIHEVWVGQATLELRPNAQAPVYLLPVEEVVEGYYWRATSRSSTAPCWNRSIEPRGANPGCDEQGVADAG